MITEPIVESRGNVFADLGFSPDESAVLALRAELVASLRETLAEQAWSQTEAAERLGINQSLASDLIRGKHDELSLDMLVRLAARTGRRVELSLR